MTDHRTEPFERDLRAVLREPAEGPMPAAIGELLGRLSDAEPVRARTVMGRWWRGVPGERHDRRHIWALGSLGALATLVIVAVFAAGPLLRGLNGGFGAGASPTASPFPGANDAPAYTWDNGSVVMTIAGGQIVANGELYLVAPNPIYVSGDPGDQTYETLELTWKEREREMRMNLYFAADQSSWWVSELRTYNGAVQGDWITYRGPLFRTPLGRTFMGDIDLVSADGRSRVTFTGVMLEAFRPGRVHLDPVACMPAVPAAPAQPGDGTEPGQPLADSGILDMSPDEAAKMLAAKGLCVDWRYEYRTGPADGGYSEVWCTPPPASKIRNVTFSRVGNVMITTVPLDDTARPIRPQPAAGWNC